MDAQTLRPRREKIELKGKLSYRESTGSWSVLRLGKELVSEFPQLKEKTSSFGYKLVFYHEYALLEKFIRKLKKDKEAVPILVWLVKEKTT